jgi:hypothetical protein
MYCEIKQNTATIYPTYACADVTHVNGSRVDSRRIHLSQNTGKPISCAGRKYSSNDRHLFLWTVNVLLDTERNGLRRRKTTFLTRSVLFSINAHGHKIRRTWIFFIFNNDYAQSVLYVRSCVSAIVVGAYTIANRPTAFSLRKNIVNECRNSKCVFTVQRVRVFVRSRTRCK